MVDWTDKKRGLIGTPTYPSRTNSLSFNAGQRENLGGLFQSQSFEGTTRIKRFGMYEQVFDTGGVGGTPATDCCNVSEYARSPMKCGTTQQLSIVTDYTQRGITAACTATRYRWTLGLTPGARYSYKEMGSLNVTNIANPIYTAPECEDEEDAPHIQTTVRISLFCNDVLADYMDIVIQRTVCCPKAINYETLTMFCGDSQILSPEEWSVDCDPSIYVWEIETEGGGTFGEVGDGDYTRTYNAPTCGAGCVNTVKINLYCDSLDPCDSIEITIYPCPKNAAITYTTQQMQVSESQTLGIDKGDGQCGTGASWLWSITSGGGTLSDPTNPLTCTYTAPATNANCLQNPTISLSCDGVEMDTLDIAVNAYVGDGYAYGVKSDLSCGDPYKNGDYKMLYASVTSNQYRCDGTLKPANCTNVVSTGYSSCRLPWWCQELSCPCGDPPEPYTVSCENVSFSYPYTVCDALTYALPITGGVVDLRGQYITGGGGARYPEASAGCCPAALL